MVEVVEVVIQILLEVMVEVEVEVPIILRMGWKHKNHNHKLVYPLQPY
jgi:hypothetical protein